MSKITLLRVYDSDAPYLKHSFLIDRFWPRGISKSQLNGVTWLKTVAPSSALHEWFHQHPENWSEFEKKYKEELKMSESWKPLYELMKVGKSITLLYGSKDKNHNQAVVLKDFLKKKALS